MLQVMLVMLHVKYKLLEFFVENLTLNCIFFCFHRLIHKVIHINLITKTIRIASEYKHIKLACTLHWHWLIK
jgi:hypothetical protein